jgi:hypothetical protein
MSDISKADSSAGRITIQNGDGKGGGGSEKHVYVDSIVKDNWTKITLISVLTKREVKDKIVKSKAILVTGCVGL